jgi:hypothetical protein
MPRFYYEFSESNQRWHVFDRRLSRRLAICYRHDDAEKIVDALNR